MIKATKKNIYLHDNRVFNYNPEDTEPQRAVGWKRWLARFFAGINDFFIKMIILKYLLTENYDLWKKEIWKRDLSGRYCCDGKMCGCGGMTVKEAWYNKKL